MPEQSIEFLLSTPFTVRMHEVGPDGLAPVQVLLRFFQEAAGWHAEALGWGAEELMEYDLAWVLARLVIQIDRFPGPREEVMVETWPESSTKYTAKRDFRIRDASGDIVALGASNWVMMDVKARRMKSIPPIFQEKFSLDLPPAVAQFQGKKIPGLSEPQHRAEIIARNEDLDLNGHANNTHIAAWVLESVPPQQFQKARLRSLDVQFRSEVRAHERLVAGCGSSENGSLAHSLVKEDGTEAARAVSTWVAL